ncbi:MAG: hypothetical protein ACJAQW_000441, partial [Paracoccaceae bacterium]
KGVKNRMQDRQRVTVVGAIMRVSQMNFWLRDTKRNGHAPSVSQAPGTVFRKRLRIEKLKAFRINAA